MDVYDNFHTVPLEQQDPDDDGNDRVPVDDRETSPVRMLTAAAVTDPVLVVPFRSAAPGAHGDHVWALKRAHARFRGGGRLAMLAAKPRSVKRTWSRYSGPGSFTRDFAETRRRLGLPATPTVYDAAAWRKLAPWFDAYALSLLVPAATTVIAKQIAWHMALYNRRAAVSYSQARPSQLGKPETISRADCSGSVAGGCHWAKILPQVDWRYTNTDTQIRFGEPVINLAAALPGDVVFYGRGNDPSHEALYLGGGRVWSFGSYPIKILAADYRHDRIAIRRYVRR